MIQIADKIYDALRDKPEGMRRTQISELFNRHAKKEEIDKALEILSKKGVATPVRNETDGRTAEVWGKTPAQRHFCERVRETHRVWGLSNSDFSDGFLLLLFTVRELRRKHQKTGVYFKEHIFIHIHLDALRKLDSIRQILIISVCVGD